MIHSIGLTEENELVYDFSIDEIHQQSFKWYWIDIENPDQYEEDLLHSFFHFHPLAIEDCLHGLQRPKLNYYNNFTFLAIHSLEQESLSSRELNIFLGMNYVVTFHYSTIPELKTARKRVFQQPTKWKNGHHFIVYQILDKIVDDYFPILYGIEDQLNEIEEALSPSTVHLSMDNVFEVRGDLLRLRRTIIPMSELLYRMLASARLEFKDHERAYFSDIYDHLLRLTEMLDFNRQLTSDIRDSQLSINSNQMNRIMMTLTIISSIFIPLTFIAGVYGMNFTHMPELNWHYGYTIALVVMAIIGVAMLLWFKQKGWLRLFKT
ncbi:magnesium/cobalt transporter CorA [Sporosarcina sp. HYO08]|uniref:magnesium/cobalt transporter CorA n=1 Tax=Sporosarcina sp. HYO08 TaxID=1759557 RepID=UPI000795FE3F|nr:magnesium/cobalt transporter CorA [Sporosarcina sp. HYO08]KXH80103.1 metal transporter [Sporosarcina sp. HYO08]